MKLPFLFLSALLCSSLLVSTRLVSSRLACISLQLLALFLLLLPLVWKKEGKRKKNLPTALQVTRAAAASSTDNRVTSLLILLLPITFSSSFFSSSIPGYDSGTPLAGGRERRERRGLCHRLIPFSHLEAVDGKCIQKGAHPWPSPTFPFFLPFPSFFSTKAAERTKIKESRVVQRRHRAEHNRIWISSSLVDYSPPLVEYCQKCV